MLVEAAVHWSAIVYCYAITVLWCRLCGVSAMTSYLSGEGGCEGADAAPHTCLSVLGQRRERHLATSERWWWWRRRRRRRMTKTKEEDEEGLWG